MKKSAVKALRYTLSFMIIDVTGSSYNDVYALNADRVLKTAQIFAVRFAQLTCRRIREVSFASSAGNRAGDAARIAERLRKSFARPNTGRNRVVDRGDVSTGISSFSGSRQTPLSIMETADRALYQAKTRGRNCCGL